MTTPDDGLAARLAEFAKSDCRDNEFAKWCQTAWTAYSMGQLITLADHTRLVKEAVEAERAACAWTATSFLVGDPKNGVPLRGPMASEVATAIISRKD